MGKINAKNLDKYNGFKKIILVDMNEKVLKEYYKILFGYSVE